MVSNYKKCGEGLQRGRVGCLRKCYNNIFLGVGVRYLRKWYNNLFWGVREGLLEEVT